MPDNPLARVIHIIAKSNSLKEIEENLAAANLHIIDAETSDNKCFIKAHARRMPTFTLVAQDQTAAATVSDWLIKNQQLSPERQQQVVETIAAMNNWPTKKMAD